MSPPRTLLRQTTRSISRITSKPLLNLKPCPQCHQLPSKTSSKPRRSISTTSRLQAQPSQPGDDPLFHSIVDNPPVPVRAGGKKHGPGLIILACIPITAFALGTWQVQRLGWKSELIAKFEDRLVRDPLPLPLRIDADAVKDFDYRRVWARGVLRHDLEMLIGPRLHDGTDGYLVITPLERRERNPSTGAETRSLILINRGWISKKYKNQADRPEGLPRGIVTVEGLLREPWKKNMFTPENNLEKGEFYFPDVGQMAEVTGSQPVWVEETMEADLLEAWRREGKGVPIGRPAEVNLRNNHAQYIFTWYALAAATSVMLWMVVKKPPKDLARRVRQSKEWS